MRGVSVHIGLNAVDPSHYRDGQGNPWDGELNACENDARSMADLANRQGFQVGAVLLTSEATSSSVISGISEASQALGPGDYFFLSYSGHGGQVENTNPYDDPEADRLDETWCLFDRELLDDELFAMFSGFQPGVRILVLSDSCHSGTVTRADPRAMRPYKAKHLPLSVANATEEAHRDLYARLQADVPTKRLTSLSATVALLSGCKDHETSQDGRDNGAFTAALLEAWHTPEARKSLEALRAAIESHIPSAYNQHPNLSIYSFELAPPLTI